MRKAYGHVFAVRFFKSFALAVFRSLEQPVELMQAKAIHDAEQDRTRRKKAR
jgi:hypothetical protein